MADERQWLVDLRAALAAGGAAQRSQEALKASLRQLDELFLLVVVGEFNAGKSAFVNALLGERLLQEGVTPTTSSIHRLSYGESLSRGTDAEGIAQVEAPIELLRYLSLVDTPGTNAIERHHERLTQEFVPRADLVLFVTSADRPFTESERQFLEELRDWGKKILLVINKIDLLEGEEAAEVMEFVATNALKLLGLEPAIFAVSARRALRSKEGNGAADDGFIALEDTLRDKLDESERLYLKLRNPLLVGQRLLLEERQRVEDGLDLLREDARTVDELDAQLEAYHDDLEREFGFRLADIEKRIEAMENRGIVFFDDTLRLTRLPDLLNKSRVENLFERQVVADTPIEIETQVSAIIDWLVKSELKQWQAVVQHVEERKKLHHERIVGGRAPAVVDAGRQQLLDSLGRAAQRTVSGYDRAQEASRLSESVQRSLAGAALLEVGAVGVGSLVTLLATSTAVDITGIVAAGALATMGLFVIPNRRRKAKAALRRRLQGLRQQLTEGLKREFDEESGRTLGRLREVTAPYTRFVAAERKRLSGEAETLDELASRMAPLSRRLEELHENG